jgi:hypothetical protein
MSPCFGILLLDQSCTEELKLRFIKNGYYQAK